VSASFKRGSRGKGGENPIIKKKTDNAGNNLGAGILKQGRRLVEEEGDELKGSNEGKKEPVKNKRSD